MNEILKDICDKCSIPYANFVAVIDDDFVTAIINNITDSVVSESLSDLDRYFIDAMKYQSIVMGYKCVTDIIIENLTLENNYILFKNLPTKTKIEFLKKVIDLEQKWKDFSK